MFIFTIYLAAAVSQNVDGVVETCGDEMTKLGMGMKISESQGRQLRVNKISRAHG